MAHPQIKAADLMPKQAAQLELLQARAVKLAENLTAPQQTEKSQQYLQFKLNHQSLYGIPQTLLDEVIYPQHLVNLAWLPAFISGVMPWKGMILTVLDGNYLCSKETTVLTELSRIIVLSYQEQFIGLLVNELCNFFSYKPSQLKTPLQSPLTFNADYFLGLADYSVIFLDVAAIFNDPMLRIAHQQP